MKHCAACNMEHDVSAFGPDKRASDGLRSSCQESRNAVQRKGWSADPDRYYLRHKRRASERYHTDEEFRRRRLVQVRGSKSKRKTYYVETDLTKRRARNRLRMAVYRGTILRPANCQQCGAAKPLQGHHTDYTKWDDVRWLCAQCHSDEHRQ